MNNLTAEDARINSEYKIEDDYYYITVCFPRKKIGKKDRAEKILKSIAYEITKRIIKHGKDSKNNIVG